MLSVPGLCPHRRIVRPPQSVKYSRHSDPFARTFVIGKFALTYNLTRPFPHVKKNWSGHYPHQKTKMLIKCWLPSFSFVSARESKMPSDTSPPVTIGTLVCVGASNIFQIYIETMKIHIKKTERKANKKCFILSFFLLFIFLTVGSLPAGLFLTICRCFFFSEARDL